MTYLCAGSGFFPLKAEKMKREPGVNPGHYPML